MPVHLLLPEADGKEPGQRKEGEALWWEGNMLRMPEEPKAP